MALGAYRSTFLAIGGFSGLINLLMLTGSLFMLQVYDRVLPSRSIPTLVGLCVLVAVLYAFQGVLETIRSRLLTRISAGFDQHLSARIFQIVVRLPLKARGAGDGLRPLRDFDQVASFIGSAGPAAFFDLPWIPLYIGIAYAFHPALGLTALGGGLLLIAIALWTDRSIRFPSRAVAAYSAHRNALADATRRNAEVLAAMGMEERFTARWRKASNEHRRARDRVGDISGGLGAMTRISRMGLQSLVLGIGAYLVLVEQASAGVIIASSILTARGLAPIEQAVAHWKGFLAAKQSWGRLSDLLAAMPAQPDAMELPEPGEKLTVEHVSLTPPGGRKAVVEGVAFAVPAGSALGVIGPSGSGKSSLARALAGVWRPYHGHVRLDGASLDQWNRASLGRHIGFLPQDVELFAGTVAENIARFEPDADPADIVAAARAAGVHELILRLPEGYETDIGESGMVLSAGQRQRVALARALYRDPFLVILDEPNSNLDAEGEEALSHAIRGVRARGGIAVVIAHRPSAIEAVDLLLVMNGGRQQAFGPKMEVLNRVLRHETSRPLVVVHKGEQAGS
ncbi:type I secretion system permease/ATPase [Stappia sp. F7233]|uniref:Type I secretion system permease/ATPase n=1 Tax=Stappia albiluteola TaxID=2758565 RepID=A0A839AG70_9HYPH|nr:type I secretion system permease/ATPase [Stappia albiluteola]MBA5777862.1 type I secretion system permease/ATPase [Stappia albiluteola]